MIEVLVEVLVVGRRANSSGWCRRKLPLGTPRNAAVPAGAAVPLCARIIIVMFRTGNHQSDVERGIKGESGMFSFFSKC